MHDPRPSAHPWENRSRPAKASWKRAGFFCAPPNYIAAVLAYFAPVVKDQTLSAASGLPARSFTPPVPPLILASYRVRLASVADGSSVTVLPSGLSVTVAWTCAPVSVSTSVPLFASVAGSIDSEKLAVTLVVRDTFSAPSAGVTLVTVGTVVSTVNRGSNRPLFVCAVFRAAMGRERRWRSK